MYRGKFIFFGGGNGGRKVKLSGDTHSCIVNMLTKSYAFSKKVFEKKHKVKDVTHMFPILHT